MTWSPYLCIFISLNGIYRIMAVLKVETDIITSIAASLTGWAVKLVIMYVAIFKTGVIVFIGKVKMSLWTDLIFLWIKVSSVIQTLSAAHIKGKMSNLPIKYLIVYLHFFLFKFHIDIIYISFISVCKQASLIYCILDGAVPI